MTNKLNVKSLTLAGAALMAAAGIGSATNAAHVVHAAEEPNQVQVNKGATKQDNTKQDAAKDQAQAKTQADQNDPKAVQNVKASLNGKLDPSDLIDDFDNLPAGTTASFKAEPDLSKSGNINVEVTVTYPDKSTDTVSVPVTVQSQADQFEPQATKNKQEFQLNAKAPEASSFIENMDVLPSGTKAEWNAPDKVASDMKKAGNYSEDVKVTFADGSTKDVKAEFAVLGEGENVDTDKDSEKLDTAKLDEAIKSGQEIQTTDGFKNSTADEQTAVVDAVKAGQDAKANDASTQDQINAATEKINKAIDALSGTKKTVSEVKKDDLNASIKKATDFKNDKAYKNASEENQKKFDNVLTDAQKVADDKEATQVDVDGANTALNQAMKTMTDTEAKKEKAAADAKSKSSESYPEQKATPANTASYPQQKDTASYPQQLPQTGNSQADSITGAVGLALASLTGLTGSVVLRKKKTA